MERRADEGRPRAAAPQDPGTTPSWEQFVRESLAQAAWPVALVPPPRRALTVDHQETKAYLPRGEQMTFSYGLTRH